MRAIEEVKTNRFKMTEKVYIVDDSQRREHVITGLHHQRWTPENEDGSLSYFSRWSYQLDGANRAFYPEEALCRVEADDASD